MAPISLGLASRLGDVTTHGTAGGSGRFCPAQKKGPCYGQECVKREQMGVPTLVDVAQATSANG